MNSKTESDTKTSNMMDSQETLQTEENVTENVAPEVNETENQTIEAVSYTHLTLPTTSRV